MDLFGADTTIFLEKLKSIILLTKSLKTPSKVTRNIFTLSCQNGANRRILCSKMWLIDQLFIKLGL